MCLYPDNPYARLVGLTRNLRFQRLILVQKKAEKTVSIPCPSRHCLVATALGNESENVLLIA